MNNLAEETPQTSAAPPSSIKTSQTQGLSVRQKIGIGFGGLILLMTLSNGITLIKVTGIADITHSVIETRQPNANLFQRLDQDLNLATTLLHGYLLTGEKDHREEFLILEQDIMEGITTAYNLKFLHENEGVAQIQLERAEELFIKFRAYARELYDLHDSNTNNRGMILAQDTLNPSASAFLGTVNMLLTSGDVDPNNPEMVEAYSKLQELRYNWVQMMSSLRIYIITQAEAHRINFSVYLRQADKLLSELNKMDVEIGFGELEELATVRTQYVSKLQPVFDIFEDGDWRADTALIKAEVNPLLEELRNIFESIADEQMNLAKESGSTLTEANEQIQLSTVILLAIALLLGLLFEISITTGIVPPIQRLLTAPQGA